MTEKEKMIRENMDAWHQKVLDDYLEKMANIVANVPLEDDAPKMRLAAVTAIKNLIIGI